MNKSMNPETSCTSLRVPVEFRARWDALVPHGAQQSTLLQATLEWLEVAEDRDKLHASEIFEFPCDSRQVLARIPREVHARVRIVARRVHVPVPLIYLAAMKTWVDNSEEEKGAR